VPIADVRTGVGKCSAETQSNEFQPATEQALKTDAAVTTSVGLARSAAGASAAAAASNMPTCVCA
jgi:mevalonate pyrophosphate decarboxylase